MIKDQNFLNWVDDITSTQGFERQTILKQGTWYDGTIRDQVWAGTWQNQSAVLKIWSEPSRINLEPQNLQLFHQHNTSLIITAPRLVASKLENAHQGWMIIEKIPASAISFASPLSAQDQEYFLELYADYRQSFPTEAPEPSPLDQTQAAADYAVYRLSAWHKLASNKELERKLLGQPPLIDREQFPPLYRQALARIRGQLASRPMHLCHGHFKANEIWQGGKIFLLDFAHMGYYPEGHELAFIAWAEYVMNPSNWSLSYSDWQGGLEDWLHQLEALANELKTKNTWSLLRVSVLERLLGTILADIAATDIKAEVARPRLDYLYRGCRWLLSYF